MRIREEIATESERRQRAGFGRWRQIGMAARSHVCSTKRFQRPSCHGDPQATSSTERRETQRDLRVI